MMMLKKGTMIVVSMLLLAGCVKTSDTKDTIQNKDAAPTFVMQDTQGKTHNLSDYKGKKLYIKMWASWCPICLSGLDALDKLEMEDKDYTVITIVAPGYKNEKSSSDFITWFSSLEYKNIQVLLDPDGEYMQTIGVRGYPTSVFIDTKGDVKKIQPGHVSNEQIDEIMATLE